ncbi:MAG TPA: endonuclease, partial [Prosthecobacter sp.]
MWELGLERVLGFNDLLSVSFLEGGLHVSRTVARLKVKTAGGTLLGYGTGFMVSPALLLTNNHVLSSADRALHSLAEFDYKDAFRGETSSSHEFRLRPDLFFLTSSALDCTLVAVEAESLQGKASLSAFGWNHLSDDDGKIAKTGKLNIIQHPGGEAKQIALRANEITDIFDDFIHYRTDTARGSSGAVGCNDNWEVVALHHSGVPRRDAEGNPLAVDGSVWVEAMGDHRVDWIANEGVRIGSILKWLKEASLNPAWIPLRDAVFTAVPSSPLLVKPADIIPMNANAQPAIPVVANAAAILPAAASVTIPLQITVSIGGVLPQAVPVVVPSPVPVVAPAAPARVKSALTTSLSVLRESETRKYYDKAGDDEDRTAYYEGIDWTQPGDALFARLSNLLKNTHKTQPRYRPAVEVYPWVDLQPNKKLRSIYSTEEFSPEEFIRRDFEIESAREARLAEFLALEGLDSLELSQQLDALEASMPYNCEHVVPQSWFNKKEPMRGDLHHLFACESNCNSFRGNIPYYDFDNNEEAFRSECGRREEGKFEPEGGHGTVARATLYFLLRYPGVIGDASRELSGDRLGMLLEWHQNNPPGEYEKHRNQAIYAKQGNRNPLIDFPEESLKVDFLKGF